MCLVTGLFVLLSLSLGLAEVGIILQPFLNLGYGYLVARNRNSHFRWADAMVIISASGTVLFIVVSLTLVSATTLGPLMGPLGGLISVFYIPYKVLNIFPKGGRNENPSFAEDLKNIIDERTRGEKFGESIRGKKD